MTASSEFTSSASGDLPVRDANYEELIYQLAQLMRTRIEPEEFENLLLQFAVRGSKANGGFLWKQNSSGDLGCLRQHQQLETPVAPLRTAAWDDLRRDVLNSGQTRVVRTSGEQLRNQPDDSIDDSRRTVVLQPLAAESESAILLELHPQPDLSAGDDSLHDLQTFLGMLSELHIEYLKTRKLARLEEQSELWTKFEAFSRELQRFWNPSELYGYIVDGGRDLCGFDRLTLLTGSGRRCRVQAVSCTDLPSRHAETVQKLQSLCSPLTAADQELQYDGQSDQILAPEIQTKLDELLQATKARMLYVIPLRVPEPDSVDDRSSVAGALVGEHFRADLGPSSVAGLQRVASQASPAVVRAAYWQSLPAKWFLQSWISLRGSPFQPGRTAWRWLLLTILLLIGILAVVPSDFRITATGQLQPADKQHVFAPFDAVVSEIHFEEDQPVRTDRPLLTLRDPDLELKLEEVRGERARVETRLKTIQTLRSNLIRNDDESVKDDELAAEANELRKLRDSLENQWKILQEKEKQLRVFSPVPGEILTWDSRDLLESRPVMVGQLLLTVADVDGDWKIEVKIPEREIGHVRRSLAERAGELRIEFSLDAQLGESYPAVLKENQIARSAEIDPDLQHFFRAEVPIDRQQQFELLSGAEVNVRIHCGSRALGYVLFHDLYEWCQRNVFY